MNIEGYYFQSEKGRREGNEDYFECHKNLFAIADGVGGYPAGEVAAKLTVQEVIRYVTNSSQPNAKILKEGVASANRLVWKASLTHPKWRGMATTLLGMLVTKTELIFANVGDSTGFLLRNGNLKPMTSPDRDEFGFLTKAIGLEQSLVVRLEREKAKSQDLMLLATDGLTDLVSPQTAREILTTSGSLQHKTKILIGEALEAGGYDNITLGLIKLA